MQVSSVISFLAAAVVTVRADSFTAEDQAIWIDRHNYFRTTGLPWSAGDMRRIGWSSDLATTAASTAAKCSAATAAGINAFQSTSTNSSSIIDEAIQQWVVETSMTTLKTLAQPGASGVDVGTGTYNSYSQVLWDSTTSVGCATASCSGGDLVVCQYSPAGNDGSSPWYVHADTASDCPSGTTASQGLCIVDGDAANNQIAAIPAGKLTYEVYPAYVANMQTVLIEAARAIASGSDNSTGSATQSTPTATTAAPTATKAPASETTSSSSSSSAATKTSKKEDTAEKTSSSKKTTTSSSSSSSSDSTATKTSTTTAPPTSSASSSDSSTKQSSKTTSSSTTDSSETKQTSTSDESAPGTVKASSDSGSTFTNQASTATESPAQQTSSSTNAASTPSTANTESTTASTTTSSGGAATSINNQSATASSGGLSAAGLVGMVVLAIVGIAAFGVVMSYKRNQQRQREIMRDGGIRII